MINKIIEKTTPPNFKDMEMHYSVATLIDLMKLPAMVCIGVLLSLEDDGILKIVEQEVGFCKYQYLLSKKDAIIFLNKMKCSHLVDQL